MSMKIQTILIFIKHNYSTFMTSTRIAYFYSQNQHLQQHHKLFAKRCKRSPSGDLPFFTSCQIAWQTERERDEKKEKKEKVAQKRRGELKGALGVRQSLVGNQNKNEMNYK